MQNNAPVYEIMDFPKMFQMELLRHLFADEDFYKRASGTIRVSDFDLPVCQTVYDALSAYYSTQGKKPELASLHMVSLEFAREGGNSTAPLRPEEMPAFHDSWNNFVNLMQQPLDTALYTEKLIPWVKRVRYNQLLMTHQNANGTGIDSMIEETKKLELLENIGEDRQFIDAWRHVLPIVSPSDVIRITTGLLPLDRRINGGLGIGELGVIMASPGVGKTTALINFAIAAAYNGYRTLIITCELKQERIAYRQMSISAHIPNHLLQRPITEWPASAFDRWRHARDIMPMDGVVIIDKSTGPTSLAEVESTIMDWKSTMTNRYGPTASPLLVCLDWLHPDYLTFPAAHDTKSYEYVASLTKRVGQLGRRCGVGMWSAAQASAKGDGKEVMRMGDIAGAYAINHALDIGCALAPIKDYADRQDISLAVGGEDDDAAAVTLVQDGRRLSMNSTKNRDAPPFRFELYQSPTLRFWPKKEAWTRVSNKLVAGGLAQLDEDLGMVPK